MKKTQKHALCAPILTLLSGAAIILASVSTASAQTRVGFVIDDHTFYRVPHANNDGTISTQVRVDITLELTDTDANAPIPTSIDAASWGALLEIQADGNPLELGPLEFNAPEDPNAEPNLPASTAANAFTSFDVDFGGMSYGHMRTSGATVGWNNDRMAITAPYIPPAAGDIGDANGNLSVNNGAALVSIPLLIGPSTTGAPGSTIDYGIRFAPGDGDFSSVTYRDAAGDKFIYPVGVHTAGFITITETIPGDANLDGVVGGSDYAIWYNANGSAGNWLTGDFSNDGVIGGSDYAIWYNANGSSAPSPGASPTAVPEPSTALLLLASIPALLGRRRRSR